MQIIALIAGQRWMVNAMKLADKIIELANEGYDIHFDAHLRSLDFSGYTYITISKNIYHQQIAINDSKLKKFKTCDPDEYFVQVLDRCSKELNDYIKRVKENG